MCLDEIMSDNSDHIVGEMSNKKNYCHFLPLKPLKSLKKPNKLSGIQHLW